MIGLRKAKNFAFLSEVTSDNNVVVREQIDSKDIK